MHVRAQRAGFLGKLVHAIAQSSAFLGNLRMGTGLASLRGGCGAEVRKLPQWFLPLRWLAIFL